MPKRRTAQREPIILVSNDDGIFARGLTALVEAMESVGAVYVAAPDRERSTVGHALTLHRPLRVEAVGERRYSINGTPSDCVNLAVLGLLPERPAVVVSGINHGSNLGDDVTYSGTVSAAMEGVLLGVPSLAISLAIQVGEEYHHASDVAARLVRLILHRGLPKDTLLNVNVPTLAGGAPPRGVRFTRLGRRIYSEKIVEEKDPRGKVYYWIGGGPPRWSEARDTDFESVNAGFVSVTPLHLDLTNYRALRSLGQWAHAPELRVGVSRPRRRRSPGG